MNLQLKAFGIARDVLGGREVGWPFGGTTVGDLKAELLARHPELAGLRSLQLAVNQRFAEDDQVITPTDEVALIPPMSGG